MAEGWTYHSCVRIGDQYVCIDKWPEEAQKAALAPSYERMLATMYPGTTWECEVDRSIDLTQYITPDCVVEFPWMKDKMRRGKGNERPGG